MNIKTSSVAALAVLGTLLMTTGAQADANAETFKKLDIDGNGYLTLQEAEANPALLDAFADGDDNDDGMLNMAEFAKLEISDE